MKKLTKVLSVILTIMMILTPISVFATTIGNVKIEPKTDNTTQVQNFGNKIIGVLQVVGIIVSVAILIVLGIKYMMGSAEEKAEYKKTMIPYLVGAVLIFAAAALAKTVYDWASALTSAA